MNTTENTPRKRWSCCLILAICAAIPLLTAALLLGGVALLLLMPAPALVISEETTRITGPLTADGQIDFFKALEQKIYPPELATDENGFRIFVRTFGNVGEVIDADSQEFYRLQKYAKLGLDPDTPPTLPFPREPQTIIKEFYEATGEEYDWRLLTAINERPWTLDEYPMLADWVNECDVPLDAIADMIRKPIFFFPMLQEQESMESGKPQNLIFMLLPDVQLSREITRKFLVRALYRISQGNIDGAIDDKLTMHHFGRQVGQTGSLVQYLSGLAIEGMAVAIPVGANPEHPLTEQQIRRILAGLDALPPRASLHDVYEYERYMGLSAIQDLAISGDQWAFVQSFGVLTDLSSDGDYNSRYLGPPPGMLFLFFALLDWVSIDWNAVFYRVNEFYDTLPERWSPKTNWDSWQFLSQMLTPSSRGTILADFVCGWLLSSMEGTKESDRRRECTDNLHRLALAILLYQLEHGEMPGENWAVQIEKYLGKNPEQYFSCPSNPSASGETTYALIQYADAVSGSLMLIELPETVPLDKVAITVEEMIELFRGSVEKVETECCGRVRITERVVNRVKAHPGGMSVAHRSGAVRFLSSNTDEEELLRLLGQE